MIFIKSVNSLDLVMVTLFEVLPEPLFTERTGVGVVKIAGIGKRFFNNEIC